MCAHICEEINEVEGLCVLIFVKKSMKLSTFSNCVGKSKPSHLTFSTCVGKGKPSHLTFSTCVGKGRGLGQQNATSVFTESYNSVFFWAVLGGDQEV